MFEHFKQFFSNQRNQNVMIFVVCFVILLSVLKHFGLYEAFTANDATGTSTTAPATGTSTTASPTGTSTTASPTGTSTTAPATAPATAPGSGSNSVKIGSVIKL